MLRVCVCLFDCGPLTCAALCDLCVTLAEERASIKALALKSVNVAGKRAKSPAKDGAAAAGGAGGDEPAEADVKRSKSGGDDISVDGLVDALSTNPVFLDALATKLGVRILPPTASKNGPSAGNGCVTPSPMTACDTPCLFCSPCCPVASLCDVLAAQVWLGECRWHRGQRCG